MDRDLVVHSIFGIEPLIGRSLLASTERDQHAGGDITLSQPDLLGFAAVYIYVQFRGRYLLMNVDIHGARNLRNLLLQFLGHLIVFRLVAAYDLHINRRSQPKI